MMGMLSYNQATCYGTSAMSSNKSRDKFRMGIKGKKQYSVIISRSMAWKP